jgi:hypothetical protein
MLRIDRLPPAMHEKIRSEHAKGKTYTQIQSESSEWPEWMAVPDEVKALFPGQRLDNRLLGRWAYRRLDKTLEEVVAQGEAARRLAEIFMGRTLDEPAKAVENALVEQFFQLLLHAGDSEQLRQDLAGLARAIANMEKARLDQARRETEQAKLEAQTAEAKQLGPRDMYLRAALDLLKRLRARKQVREVLDPIKDDLVTEFSHAADEFAEKVAAA